MIRFASITCCLIALTSGHVLGQSGPGNPGPAASGGLGIPTASPVPAATAVAPPMQPGQLPTSVPSGFGPAPTQTLAPHGATGAPACCQRSQVATSACAFDPLEERWYDNLSLYAGLNGSKEPADLGVNANFGYRFAANLGIPLVEQAGLGLQVGTSLNYSCAAVRVLHFVDHNVEHTQSFSTIGLFQRGESGFNWGIAYDYRFDDYYDRYSTTQWRAQVGFAVGDDDEVGVWGTLRDRGDSSTLLFMPFTVRPLNQINFFWRHVWPNDAATRIWVGFTEDHGRFNLFFGNEPNVRHPVCFGTDLMIPLNESLAIFGEAQFVTPNDSGTVNATLGIAWYPGAARMAARNRFTPYQNVANSTTMPLDLRQPSTGMVVIQ